jgi:hypothetical protein
MPGPTPRHVGWPGPARLSLSPTKHVGRPEHGRPVEARESMCVYIYIFECVCVNEIVWI